MIGKPRTALLGASAIVLSWLAAGGAWAEAQPAPAPAAPAASGDSTTLGEVIVTAQRRSENLQRVPIAVTAFNAESLERQQVTSALDVARTVPNMFASNNVGQASANVYYIRGLGQTQSFPTFEPQVATYVDDIYLGRQNANNLALFGVEQVQVLRGPQGTLFGRNSTGGAILITLQHPKSTFGGMAEASYGSWNRFTGRASVDIPLSDSFHTRTSAFGITDDGYVRNLTTGEHLNATKSWGVREALSWTPTDHLSWDGAVDFSRNDAANVLNLPGDPGIHGAHRIAYTGFRTDTPALKPYLTGYKSTLGQGVLVRSWGAVSNFKIVNDAGVLNLITGFRGLQQDTAVDFPLLALGPAVPFDQGPTGQFALAQALKSYQYSQEVKWSGDIGRLKYTTGLFGFYETNRNNFGAVANLGPLFGLPFFAAPLTDEYTKNDTRSVAVYAQGDYSLTEALTLTLGGRFTHEVKTLKASPNAPSGFSTAQIIAAGYKTKLKTDQFTPRVAVQYQVNPQVMLFASATRGFQGGGWNGLAFNAQTFNDFGPETVWSYETGFRTETPDRKLRFNANLFYLDTRHYQLLSDLATAGSFVTNNAADMHSYGAEFELTWRPMEDLNINANVGLQHAKYLNPSPLVTAQQASCRAKPGAANPACGAGIVDFSGNLAPPTYVPKFTFAGTASYDFHLSQFVLTPTVGFQYFARQAVGTEGTPESFQKAYNLLDLSLQLKPEHGPWALTAECKNCGKTDYRTTYLFGYNYWNVPGTWDVRVSYNF
jgi:iron complex outermembrane receptor protein